jgi:hypothetical protein
MPMVCRRLILAAAWLTLAGCVGMDAAECRDADWYHLGFRDGLYGMQRMDVVYEDQCAKHGAKLDAAAYAKGWQEGVWELDSRRKHGGGD